MSEFIGERIGEVVCKRGDYVMFRPEKAGGAESILVKIPNPEPPSVAVI